MLRSQQITPIELTPEIAQRWLIDMHYESNRFISPLNLARMTRVHLRDQFPETEAIHCTVKGDDERNLDSQHRCQMVVDTRKPLWINLKLFDAASEHERRGLWKKIDRGNARQFRQAVHSDEWDEAGYHCKSEMLLVSSLTELIEGKLTLEALNARKTASFEERSEFAFAWSAAARRLFDAMAGAPNIYRDFLQRRPVMAVMLPLFADLKTSGKMTGLVSALAYNQNLQPKTPAHRLMMEIQKGESQPKGRQALEFMRKVAYCCVRYIDDLPCVAIPSETPVPLPGTDIVVG